MDEGPKLPSPTLPKGGGAIAPIGEKFVTNPQMGTASFTIPVLTSPGRGGFGPSLQLSYDGGTGNGAYGIGWSLSIPNISRKTDKGLPRYDDAAESDVFILSGAEDLVPVETVPGDETIIRYRPRVEQAFARIERHVRGDGSQYWVSYTRENIRSVYGYSTHAQLADPQNRRRVFRWMLEWTDDDKGNVVAYLYKPEDDVNVTRESNRAHTNLYPKAIAYANTVPRAARDQPPIDVSLDLAAAVADWPLVVLYDYGEHDETNPTFAQGQWPVRLDSFSSYRSGFEVRTHRLCQRILMLHKFEALGPEHVVVRSTKLHYDDPTPAVSYLTGVTQTGWRKDGGKYATADMPTIALGYGRITALQDKLHTLDEVSRRNLPDGIAGAYSLVDFDGEGLPGILSEEAGRGWFYKRPEGRDDDGAGHFGGVRRIDRRPAAALAEGFQLHDLDGDGLVDLVRPGTGLFERSDDDWLAFRPFRQIPDIDWNDPTLRFVDLDGDGFPDVLVTDRDLFRWHRALGREGYGPENSVSKPRDGMGPVPLFNTEREAVLLADMTGDGLSDIVHVRNGSVCYWPNLGYGRFGARVQMANAPTLDAPERFDPGRVSFGDIDGTGTSDLVYVRADGIHIFLNQAGNSFAAQSVIRSLPPVHGAVRFSVTDLFGTGTACLTWSSPLPADRSQPIRWVDLLDGKKPHLLETIDNGLGSRTTIAHAPSTKFYLSDRAMQRSWITKLPFPVQVVESVTIEDLVSETKFVSTYAYHHGFYDGEEREFRGFGMVEQRDTQDVVQFYGSGEFTDGLDKTLHIDPAVTQTWFHTGAFIDASTISKAYSGEYWQGDKQNPELPDSALAGDLAPEEMREAYRALRGHILRQEAYAEDNDPKLSSPPYLVAESSYTVELLQSRGAGRYAVFAVHPRETLQLHYERNADDPRIQHEVVLATSKYGDVIDQVNIAYPRRAGAVTPAQDHLWATWMHRDYHDLDSLAADYRVGMPKEEIVAEVPLSSTSLVTFAQAQGAIANAPGPYQPGRRPLEDAPPAGPILIQRVRHHYWDDLVSLRLDVNTAQPRGLLYETLTLALDAGCLAVLDERAEWGETDQAALTDPSLGGYTLEDGLYWSSSGILGYDKNRFFLPKTLTNPFGGIASVDYDPAASLLSVGATDAAGLHTTAEPDFRLLSPRSVTDANGTRSEVTTDILGIVTGTAIHGAAGEGGPTGAMSYGFYAGPDQPTWIHVQMFPNYDPQTFQESFIYCDGLGRVVATKIRVKDGPLVDDGPSVSPRWVGSGRTIFNNKALPVKKYQPYFSPNSDFETEQQIRTQGVTPVLHYDPLGRVIRIDQPNGTFSQVRFDAWSTTAYDENDTVTASQWYLDRTGGGSTASAREKAAAVAAAAHWNTPKTEHLDPLGRVVLTILDNKTEVHETLIALDIEGKTLSVTDPEKKKIADHCFDIAGRMIKTHSVDAGDTWTLPDAAGQPLYSFRARGADGLRIKAERDSARRLTHVRVLKDGDTPASEVLRERVIYGPALTGPLLARGRVIDEFDSAGLAAYQYDFRGNVTHSTRRVVLDYAHEPSWGAVDSWDGTGVLPVDAALDAPLALITQYDAGNRPTQQTTPDGSITTWTYDIAGMMATVSTALGRTHRTESFVAAIEYDPKGRRKSIRYGNGIQTRYHYDPQSFRLIAIQSAQQDLSYVYDPVGNIISVADAGQPTICFANQLVAAESDYVYDAIYRLTRATGREHAGQAGLDQRDLAAPLPLPTDCTALINYAEDYSYDKAGNFQSLTHTMFLPTGPRATTRNYGYVGGTNRLLQTTIGTDVSSYAHNDRGCMKSMAHLDLIAWNHRDLLIAATRTRSGNGSNPLAATAVSNPVYFGYDLRGLRIRKVSESNGLIADRVYLGPYEIYRERSSPQAAPSLSRETLHAFEGKGRVALVETLIDGSEELVRYQLSNHLSSALVELDRNGTLISYEEFHPYGTTALQVGSGAKRYRYTGVERDEETGLEMHGNRHYAPWLGRWTATDPEGLGGGANLYGYSNQNPVIFVDRGGRAAELTVKGNEISIKVNLVVFPSEKLVKQDTNAQFIQEAIAPRIKQGIEDTWNNQKFNFEGKTYTLKVSVDIKAVKDEQSAKEYAAILGATWGGKTPVPSDVVELSIKDDASELRSHVGVTDLNNTISSGSTWDFHTQPSVYGHEAGHLFGLSDDYFEDKKKGFPQNVATPEAGYPHDEHTMGRNEILQFSNTGFKGIKPGKVAEHELQDIIINNKIDLNSTKPQRVGNYNRPLFHPSRLPDPKARLQFYREYIHKLHPEIPIPVDPPVKKKHHAK